MRSGSRAIAFGAALSFALWVFGGAVSAAPKSLQDAVALSYKPIPLSSADTKEVRVGELAYRGGLEITSPDRRFGGWSGLLVSTGGTHVLSQSDEGHWLRANLAYDKSGNLAGVTDAQLADMENLDGTRLARKEDADAEGLAALSDKGPDGPVAISFERNHRIWEYDVGTSLDVKPTVVPAPEAVAKLDVNSGLEGLAALRPGVLFAVAETAQSADGDHPAWLIPFPGSTAPYAQLGVRPHPPYEISDAAMSPDGRWLYLLERHYFGPLGGVAVAVRRVDASTVKPGARLEGEEIAKFTMHENIDNMEGLALRRDASGHTLLYMISDDNYDHLLQRTVLLMFEVER
jgi:hypothetical protein